MVKAVPYRERVEAPTPSREGVVVNFDIHAVSLLIPRSKTTRNYGQLSLVL